jgi:predicted AAA+ superfamily ATPase
MHNIVRDITQLIKNKIKQQKVVVILGARRVGKTVLVDEMLKTVVEPVLKLNGEDISIHHKLAERSIENYKSLIGSYRMLYIDEAQKIPDIGLKLKLMIDEIKGLKIIITGSSALDINKNTGEPLTGRKYTFNLFPLSENEFNQTENAFNKLEKVMQRLVYGCYPELLHIDNEVDKREYLNDLVSSYLLKDILAYENIENSQKIFNLLRLLAYQIGGEVSYQELGKQLGISKNTVEKYLDLLQKVFIIKKVEGFSRNLRKEITKNSRWYFVDNGIRNSIIANFNAVNFRNDTGQLWENYLISERLKFQQYNRVSSNNYFWRTYNQQEIDWVEEREGKLFGYEFKWKSQKVKTPSLWQKTYKEASFEVITQDNFSQWLKFD